MVHSLLLLLATLHGSHGNAPIGGNLYRAQFAADGRYAVAQVSVHGVYIWDLTRLWQPLQPVLVDAFSHDGEFDVNGHFVAWTYKDVLRVRRLTKGLPIIHEWKADKLSQNIAVLSLSPDGSRLVAGIDKNLTCLTFGDTVVTKVRQEPDASALVVDWARDRVLLGRADGTVSLFDLKTLRELKTLTLGKRFIERLQFTPDGTHAYVVWSPEDDTERLFQIRVSLKRGIPGDLRAKVKQLEDTDTGRLSPNELTITDSSGAMWDYSYSEESQHLELQTLGPDGTYVRGGDRWFPVIGSSRVYDVGPQRNRVLIGSTEDNRLYLYDARHELPLARLTLSRIGYQSGGVGTIAHIAPRIGMSPAYPLIERLGLRSPQVQTQRLLWLASLLTSRKERYDRVWFSLLARDLKPRGPRHERERTILSELPGSGDKNDPFGLSEGRAELRRLCGYLVRLDEAEHLFSTREYESCLRLLRTMIASLRALQRDTPALGTPRIDEPHLPTLIGHQWSVLERESWYLSGEVFRKMRSYTAADAAYSEVLKLEPFDWRGYMGKMEIALLADDAEYVRFRDAVQNRLKLKWLVGPPPAGLFREEFFEPQALADARKFAGIDLLDVLLEPRPENPK